MLKPIDGKHSILYGGLEPSIVKTSTVELIPRDEPVFLFRARDKFALATLQYYCERCAIDGCTDEHMEGIHEAAEAFAEFAEKHPERMKQPGITRGK